MTFEVGSPDSAGFSLADRVVLVIGGTGGLGFGIARALAGAGATVALAARSAERLAGAARALRAAPTFRVDVTNVADLPPLMSRVCEQLGRLDVLVNAAGLNIRQRAADVMEEDWSRVFDVNLRAVFFACQAAAREMRELGGGKIINLASGSDVVTVPDVTVYAASKAGVRQLTRSLAVEWAPDRINVNAVAPGRFRTEQTEGLFADVESATRIIAAIPAGRPGTIADLGGLCVLLASPAGDYITGQTITVDGGWTLARQEA